jgi:thioredoxin 1
MYWDATAKHRLVNVKKVKLMAGESLIEIKDSNFSEVITKSGTPVLVDFWASWCGPCKAVAPVIEKLSVDYSGKVVVGKLNVDENRATAQRYGIMSIPTVILFKGGAPVEVIVGARQAKDYMIAIDKHI